MSYGPTLPHEDHGSHKFRHYLKKGFHKCKCSIIRSLNRVISRMEYLTIQNGHAILALKLTTIEVKIFRSKHCMGHTIENQYTWTSCERILAEASDGGIIEGAIAKSPLTNIATTQSIEHRVAAPPLPNRPLHFFDKRCCIQSTA